MKRENVRLKIMHNIRYQTESTFLIQSTMNSKSIDRKGLHLHFSI